MRAITVRQPGGVEVLEVAELPDPRPGPRQLLVRNFATALNRVDLLQRRGLYPPPPGESEILGLEFAGEVAAGGDEVRDFRRGDRVFGLVGGGSYAEFLCVDERLAVSIPDNLSFDAAAAVPEAFYTAQENLFALARLQAGQRVVVHAGASGVGTAALQLARAFGLEALATAGTAAKVERCVELGAARAVDYRHEDFVAAARELTAGQGVDAVLDLIGASYWERNLQSLRDGGVLLVCGLLGGARVTADLGVILRRRLRILGNAMRTRSLEDKIAITDRFRRDVLPLLERGEVHAVIDTVLPMEEVQEAHRRMEANLNIGKIVLRM